MPYLVTYKIWMDYVYIFIHVYYWSSSLQNKTQESQLTGIFLYFKNQIITFLQKPDIWLKN